MKYIVALLCLVATSSVMAHEDHALGQGTFHFAYHVAFWSLCALVTYKGFVWYKAKINSKQK
jgi:hypothetical protein